MSQAQHLDAALCLLAGLIANQLPDPKKLASDLDAAAGHFSHNQELASLLKRLAVAVSDGQGR